MLGTTLNYVALRLLGEGPEGGGDGAVTKARKWVLDHEGATLIPAWGKVYLSGRCGVICAQFTRPCLICTEDLYTSRSIAQNLLLDGVHYLSERLLKQWPFSKLREQALQEAIKHIHYEDESTRYMINASIEKSMNMMACWAEDPTSDAFKFHFARVPDILWLAEDGMKTQSVGSQLWDAAFATQAIIASNLVDEYGSTLRKAHEFLKLSQEHISKGAWTLSVKDHGWQVSDCTAEALRALLLLSQMPAEIVGETIDTERLHNAIDFLLSLQRKNGGFSVWEPARGQRWLEVLNPTQAFGDVMVETEFLHPGYRSKEIQVSVANASSYVEDAQMNDGSW
ncbi:beta-amyrin synthase-like isoform X4 [Populus alba x Populus x berolinensis]|nr:beta-amyrin synthase-like isoform X4 [Populus alba x Populus x berolinensis]